MSEVNKPQEVSSQHLARLAIVYVRQSTEMQVQHNTGSTEAQRNQRRFALEWGWRENDVRTIEDLGLSGTSADRPGYREIVDLIEHDAVGILLAVDFTRFGRDAAQWFTLLNLCARFDVLVALDGRVYDMRVSGHVVFAKLMAVISEIDTSYRAETMRRGRIAKAAKGVSVTRAPMGYVQKTWELDPRPWAQSAIKSVFGEYLRTRSVHAVVKALNEQGVVFPSMKKPTRPEGSTVLRILRNFAYTGAYEFGKTRLDPARRRSSSGAVCRIPVPRVERIVIPQHHEAYVTLDDWNEIQRSLTSNATSGTGRPPGRGRGLLERRICCPVHAGVTGARRLMVHYGDHRRDAQRSHLYLCKGDRARGGELCISLPGRLVDHAVRRAVLARLAPPRIAALREALEDTRLEMATVAHHQHQHRRELERRLEDLRYRATVIDPTHRLIVETLESELRKATEALRAFDERIEREHLDVSAFDEADLDTLGDLSGDFDQLFDAPSTSSEERKEVIAALVDSVTVVERNHEVIRLRIAWMDDEAAVETEIRLPPYVHRIAKELAALGLRPFEIARHLNGMGLLTRDGAPWRAGPMANLLRMRRRKLVRQIRERGSDLPSVR